MVVLFFPISLCSAKPPTATHQPELLFRVLISSSDDDSLVFPVHPIYCSSFPALATVRPQRWMCREKSIPNPATKELPKILPSSEHDIISLDKKRELCEEGRGNGQRGIEVGRDDQERETNSEVSYFDQMSCIIFSGPWKYSFLFQKHMFLPISLPFVWNLIKD